MPQIPEGAPDQHPSSSLPRRILVADDSETVRRVVALACTPEAIQVTAVSDGDAAVAQMQDWRPDLALLDVRLPGRSGYEVASFMRSRPDLGTVPVILLAGMFEPADQGRAEALGCAAILVKPLTPQHLLSTIKAWIGRAQPEPTAQTGAADDYFARLDDAFKSLGRPIGRPLPGDVDGASAESGTVPTLHELLEKLPQEARERLIPGVSPGLEAQLVDALTRKVAERLVVDDQWLDQLATRLAQRDGRDDGR